MSPSTSKTTKYLKKPPRQFWKRWYDSNHFAWRTASLPFPSPTRKPSFLSIAVHGSQKNFSVWSDACHVLMCCGVAFLLHWHLCSTRFNMLHVRCLGCRQMCWMSFGSSVRGFCSLGHIVVTCKKVCKNIPIKFSAYLVQCWWEFVALTSAMPCPRVQPASFIKSCQMYTIFVSFQPISHHYIMSFKWPAEHMWGQTIHPQLSGQVFLPHPVHSRRGMLGDGFPSQLRQLGIQVYHTTHLFLGNQWPKFPVTARVSGSIWC